MWLVHLIDDGDDKDDDDSGVVDDGGGDSPPPSPATGEYDDDGNALMITRRLTIKLSKHAGNVLVEFFIAT